MTRALSAGGARAVLDALEEGIVVVADGLLAACNASAARLLGTTREALCGAPSLSARWGVVDGDGRLLAPEDHPDARAVRTGRPVLGTVLGVRREDGAFVWLRVNAHPLRGTRSNGGTGQVLLTFVDVTAERAAAAEADRARGQFGRLAARVPVGVFELDASGECTYANSHATALFGTSADGVLGDGWLLAFAAADRDALLDGWAAAVEGGTGYRHVVRVLRAGQGAPARGCAVALALDPLRDRRGRLCGFLGSATAAIGGWRALVPCAAARDSGGGHVPGLALRVGATVPDAPCARLGLLEGVDATLHARRVVWRVRAPATQ